MIIKSFNYGWRQRRFYHLYIGNHYICSHYCFSCGVCRVREIIIDHVYHLDLLDAFSFREDGNLSPLSNRLPGPLSLSLSLSLFLSLSSLSLLSLPLSSLSPPLPLSLLSLLSSLLSLPLSL